MVYKLTSNDTEKQNERIQIELDEHLEKLKKAEEEYKKSSNSVVGYAFLASKCLVSSSP